MERREEESRGIERRERLFMENASSPHPLPSPPLPFLARISAFVIHPRSRSSIIPQVTATFELPPSHAHQRGSARAGQADTGTARERFAPQTLV